MGELGEIERRKNAMELESAWLRADRWSPGGLRLQRSASSTQEEEMRRRVKQRSCRASGEKRLAATARRRQHVAANEVATALEIPRRGTRPCGPTLTFVNVTRRHVDRTNHRTPRTSRTLAHEGRVAAARAAAACRDRPRPGSWRSDRRATNRGGQKRFEYSSAVATINDENAADDDCAGQRPVPADWPAPGWPPAPACRTS